MTAAEAAALPTGAVAEPAAEEASTDSSAVATAIPAAPKQRVAGEGSPEAATKARRWWQFKRADRAAVPAAIATSPPETERSGSEAADATSAKAESRGRHAADEPDDDANTHGPATDSAATKPGADTKAATPAAATLTDGATTPDADTKADGGAITPDADANTATPVAATLADADAKGPAADKPAEASATETDEAASEDTEAAAVATLIEDQEPDKWAEFAGRTEPPPGVGRRVGRWSGRVLRHEWAIAAFVSLAGAVVMTWPTLRYPRHTIPQDVADPTLQAWQMAWSGHSLLTDPGRLWHANAFYPELWSFAFSDGLLGYAPLGMIGEGPVAAIVRYNIVFVLAHALATFGAYVLVRQLGAGRTGAAVAAAAYTYAPWLLSQAGHLHILSNGGIPLSLAMLARGHGFSFRHGYRPERRHAGWALAGWLVAAWQLSIGFGIGLVFAYVLALLAIGALVGWFVSRTWRWDVRRPFGRKLFFADLGGGVIFAAVGGLLAIPYFEVADAHPYARRGVEEIELYSPPLRGFFTAPDHSWLWGGLHAQLRDSLGWAPEMTLLPGFTLIGLALAGLIVSIWTVKQRLLMVAAIAVTTILAMGSEFLDGKYTYLPLLEHVPGWDGIRTPGRLMLWVTLLLGILAAGAVCAFVDRVKEMSANRIPPWPSPWLRLVTLIPLALVLVEGINTTPHPIVPAQPAAMRTVEGPLLVLPSDALRDENVMLWSTTNFQDIVNGGSGFVPKKLEEVRQVTATFPDQNSINYLRGMGVRNVVVVRDEIDSGSPLQTTIDLPVDSLGITREDIGNAVVFHL
ncbi:hypothetical protein AB0J74_23915 [Asanoa sp. NPDC049573]|uniref:hypothetical protein n=1 Tax=Asanoa sp. NPDC049573 TaxID=3155396 RepID=UPI00341C0486